MSREQHDPPPPPLPLKRAHATVHCVRYFAELSAADYARTGCEATDTVTLKAGELQGVSHTMTEPLRKLGLPVDLQKGIVVLTRDHDVVKEGDVMTSEQARLLVRRGIFATLWLVSHNTTTTILPSSPPWRTLLALHWFGLLCRNTLTLRWQSFK